MKLIDGQKIAEKIKDQIAVEIFETKVHPNLAIILANEREDSKLYVSLKEREAQKVGIDTHLYRIEESESEADLLKLINFLNQDETIDGILVQLPLPEKFDTDKVIMALEPEKDVDGFHPNKPEYILGPVAGAILECLKACKCDLKAKRICLLHNSEAFGKGLKDVLKALGAEVTTIAVNNFDKLNNVDSEAKIQEIVDAGTEADIFISALGLPKFVKAEMIKAEAIVIDVGISKIGKAVLGDVDALDVAEKAAYLTPVPGGIGPLTIACLFRNVLTISQKRFRMS